MWGCWQWSFRLCVAAWEKAPCCNAKPPLDPRLWLLQGASEVLFLLVTVGSCWIAAPPAQCEMGCGE